MKGQVMHTCKMAAYISVPLKMAPRVMIPQTARFNIPTFLPLLQTMSSLSCRPVGLDLAVCTHRFGSFLHVAILEPRWCPRQIQVLSHKLTAGGPGPWRQIREVPSQICADLGQKQPFFAQSSPIKGS